MDNDIDSKNRVIKKIIKIVLKILYQMLIIMCVILTMIIVLQKVTDSNRSIAGYRIFRVISGSMLPEYNIGEVVICKDIDPRDIKVGDDIVYQGKYGEYSGKTIMHEVTAIDVDENNNLNFHAKGLHSASTEDPEIKASQIYGIVKVKARILTYIYKLATSIYSAFIIITVLVLNVFVSFKFPGNSKKVQRLAENAENDEEEYEDEEYDDEEYDDIEEEDDMEDDLEEDQPEEED